MKKNYKNISVISTGSWVPTDLNKKTKSENTYKILINQLILDDFIGIHDFEKKKKQKISISLSLDVNDNISGIEHKIENFVSYEHIVADIKSILKKAGDIVLTDDVLVTIDTSMVGDIENVSIVETEKESASLINTASNKSLSLIHI